MHPYYMRDAQSAQIQATGISLQVGHRIWGIAPNSWFVPNGQGRRRGASAFIASLVICAPDYQSGVRTSFEFRTPWFVIKRIGRGEYRDLREADTGWHVARRMCRGVNI